MSESFILQNTVWMGDRFKDLPLSDQMMMEVQGPVSLHPVILQQVGTASLPFPSSLSHVWVPD